MPMWALGAGAFHVVRAEFRRLDDNEIKVH